MKKKQLLMSVMVIGIAAAMFGAGTFSYFSDVETSTGNTFTTGTIDIAIDDQNPWTGSFSFDDIKPCRVEYITFSIENVGTNPVNVFKHLKEVVCSGGADTYHGASSEPEYTAGGGEFDEYGTPTGGYTEKCNINKVIIYDLSVEVYDGDDLIWWQVIIPEESRVTVKDVTCHDIPLGMIPVGGYMIVTQSYHMKAETGNWAQGDVMTFDIEIYGEQLNGPKMPGLLLVPKMQAGPTGETGEWIIDWDKVFGNGGPDDWQGTYGYLTYNTKGSEFEYSFEGFGLEDVDYSLIYYADPWPGNKPGALIDSGTASDGELELEGSIELGMDLPHPNDANPGAKIWLVTSSDYDAATNSMIGWNQGNYLFEFSLIHYDETDV